MITHYEMGRLEFTSPACPPDTYFFLRAFSFRTFALVELLSAIAADDEQKRDDPLEGSWKNEDAFNVARF
jgi:hypothetical protein